MRILVVCSGNYLNFDIQKHQAFVYDQVEALKQLDVNLSVDYFFVIGKGLTGYLSSRQKLIRQLRTQRYQCIHAHVAVSGMLANLQRQVPVITTFHGSDINLRLGRILSGFVEILSKKTIYVSPQLAQKSIYSANPKQAVIPCGVDLTLFIPRPKQKSREKLGLSLKKTYILFSSSFDIPVKNASLAKAAVALLHTDTTELLELKNYTREQVALLLTAVDVALLTSFSEGSPQFVKEALACNCPVVSTDVGDVRSVVSEIPGCYVTSYDPVDVTAKIQKVLTNTEPVEARDYIQRFDNRLIAQRLLTLYHQL